MASKNATMKLISTSTVKRSNYKRRERRRRMRSTLQKLKAAMEMISQAQQNFEKRGRVRKHGKKKNDVIKLLEEQLRVMEAKVAEHREETDRMRQELGNMMQAVEDRETEPEIIRMLHTRLFNEMAYMSMVEELMLAATN